MNCLNMFILFTAFSCCIHNSGYVLFLDFAVFQVPAKFSAINIVVIEDTKTLKDQLNQKTQTICSLQQNLEKAKEFEKYAEYKTKFQDVSAQYEKEKERLTKLYHLYEETEGECKQLREENQSWQNWFNSNKQIFDKLFSAVPPIKSTTHKSTTPKQFTAPATIQEEDTTPMVEDEEIDQTDSKPKKRRLRFKK